MQQIADAHAQQLHGVSTLVAQSRTLAHGGPFTYTIASETAYIEADGLAAGKRMLRSVDNGKIANATQLVKLSNDPNPPLSRFGIRVPLMGGALSDYSFGPPQQRDGFTDVAFTTRVKDESHGDGVVTLDLAQKRLEHITFRPSVLPPKATSMSVSVDLGRVFEGRWDVAKITLTFTGREAFVTGGGVTVTQYMDYKPYATAADAVKALTTIEAPPAP